MSLSLLIIVPLVTAILILFSKQPRVVALLGAVLQVVLGGSLVFAAGILIGSS